MLCGVFHYTKSLLSSLIKNYINPQEKENGFKLAFKSSKKTPTEVRVSLEGNILLKMGIGIEGYPSPNSQ